MIWDYPADNLVADSTTIKNSTHFGTSYRYRGVLVTESGASNFLEETKGFSLDGSGQFDLRTATITPKTVYVVDSDGNPLSMDCLDVIDDIDVYVSQITTTVPAASFSETPVSLELELNDEAVIRQTIGKPDWLPDGAEYYYQWDELIFEGTQVYSRAYDTSQRLVGAPWRVTDGAVLCVTNGYPDPGTNGESDRCRRNDSETVGRLGGKKAESNDGHTN